MARQLDKSQQHLLWTARRHLIKTLQAAKGNSAHRFWILVPQLILAAPGIGDANPVNQTGGEKQDDRSGHAVGSGLSLDEAHVLLWLLQYNAPQVDDNIPANTTASSSVTGTKTNSREIPVYVLWALLWPAHQHTKQRETVRRVALACLALREDVVIVSLLPQLLRLVCIEASTETPLVRMLLLRALRSPVYVGHHFLWRLRALRTGRATMSDGDYLAHIQVLLLGCPLLTELENNIKRVALKSTSQFVVAGCLSVQLRASYEAADGPNAVSRHFACGGIGGTAQASGSTKRRTTYKLGESAHADCKTRDAAAETRHAAAVLHWSVVSSVYHWR